jgi:hypothetical protein
MYRSLLVETRRMTHLKTFSILFKDHITQTQILWSTGLCTYGSRKRENGVVISIILKVPPSERQLPSGLGTSLLDISSCTYNLLDIKEY